MALEIKEGYIYTCTASTIATGGVVKRGMHFRLFRTINHGSKRKVDYIQLIDPRTDKHYEINQDLFNRSFELFETTIVSPRAAQGLSTPATVEVTPNKIE